MGSKFHQTLRALGAVLEEQALLLFLGWSSIEHYSDLSLDTRTGAVILHTATKNPTLLISLKPKHGIYIFSKLFFMVLIYM